MKRYVCGEKEQIVLDGKRKRLDGDYESFAREVEGFFYLFPEFGDVERGFPDFHNFSLNCAKPMATVLVSTQERCRMCGKALAVDPNTHVVVIYHEQRGSYLGSRVTKCCRTCKVYEHYGYWTQEGKRHANRLPVCRVDIKGNESYRFDRFVSNRNIFNLPCIAPMRYIFQV